MTTTTTTPDPLRALHDLALYADECELILRATHPAKAQSLARRVSAAIDVLKAAGVPMALAAPAPLPAQGDATDPDYDRSIHDNPDARAWAAFFAKHFPAGSPAPDEGTMIGWFANAMMAMHDHLKRSTPAPVEGDATDRLPEVAEARRALTCLYLATPEEVAADVSRKVEAAFSALRSSPSQLRPLQCVCDLPSEAAGPCPVHQPAAFSAPQPQPDGEVRRALEVLATNLENPAADRAWCARTLRSLLSAAPAPRPETAGEIVWTLPDENGFRSGRCEQCGGTWTHIRGDGYRNYIEIHHVCDPDEAPSSSSEPGSDQ